MRLRKIINDSLAHFGIKVVRLKKGPSIRPGNVYPLNTIEPDDINIEVRKLLNLVAYTKNSGSVYNAQDFQSAYHTLRIGDQVFRGQRDPSLRLDGVPFDFNGASILDLGCNQGGMLFSLADRLTWGVGLDYDHRMVNAANRIRAQARKNNLDYYVFDLDKENLELLPNFLHSGPIDIVFLLSVCMWLSNWRSVIDAAKSLAPALMFESNGSDQQQRDQEEYLRASYSSVVMVRNASPDDPGQQRRRLFLCSNGHSNRITQISTGIP